MSGPVTFIPQVSHDTLQAIKTTDMQQFIENLSESTAILIREQPVLQAFMEEKTTISFVMAHKTGQCCHCVSMSLRAVFYQALRWQIETDALKELLKKS